MRMLLAVVLALVAGCSSTEADSESPQSTAQALVDAGPALPECDGINLRHVCNVYPATATAKYGFLPKCEGTPFLGQANDAGPAFRAEGQAGCINVGYPVFDGPAYARCCP